MISIGDKVTSTANVNCGLMPTSILEKPAQFQLEVNVNNNVIFSHASPQISQTLSMNPKWGGHWALDYISNYPHPLKENGRKKKMEISSNS